MKKTWRLAKRWTKQRLTTLACHHLQLYVEPPSAISDLGHPLGLISTLRLKCRGVVHVGANLGQEFDSYLRAGLPQVVYIEPIPEVFDKLQERVSVDRRHHAINALCAEQDGMEVDFHIASNYGQSSSLLPFGTHANFHPSVTYQDTLRLTTTTLDHIVFETSAIDPAYVDCLVLDVQGAEARVLAGAKRTLGLCRFVFAEVSEGGLYLGDAPFEAIIGLLREHGFRLKSLDLNRFGWGNAFFVRIDTLAVSLLRTNTHAV